MKKSKATFKAFLVTVATVLVCCMVLIGATFAWFTSTVTSSANKIKAGTLAVDLLFTDDVSLEPTNSLRDTQAALFDQESLAPGTKLGYKFRVVNKGTLPLIYDLTFQGMSNLKEVESRDKPGNYLDADGSIVADAGKNFKQGKSQSDIAIFRLADVIDVYINGEYYAPLSGFIAGESLMNGNLQGATGGTYVYSSDVIIELEFWKGAGNEYQGLELLNGSNFFDIQLFATQQNADYQPKQPSKYEYNRKMAQTVNKVEVEDGKPTPPPVEISTGATAISLPQNTVNEILKNEAVNAKAATLEFKTEIKEDASPDFAVEIVGGEIAKVNCELNAIVDNTSTPVKEFVENVTVTLYIAKNIIGGIYIQCNGNDTKCDSKMHNPPSYDPSTGKLTFQTNHFSEFTIASTIKVVKSGASIQTAINEAEDGDTIFVQAGLYQENIVVNKNITLLGNNYGNSGTNTRKAETIICPKVDAQSILRFNNYAVSVIPVTIAALNVVFDGFTVTGDNPTVDNLWTQERNDAMQAMIDLANNPKRARASEIYNSYVGKVIPLDCAIAMYVFLPDTVDSVTGVTIQNNIIKNAAHSGIDLFDKSGKRNTTTISNNLITNINALPLLYTSGGVEAYWGQGGFAIYTDFAAVEIANNTLRDNPVGIQYQHQTNMSQESYIHDNIFTNNSVGIWVNSTGYGKLLSITGNRMSKDASIVNPLLSTHLDGAIVISSIYANNTGDLVVSANTISGYKTAIIANGVSAGKALIEKNAISNAETGIALSRNFLGYLDQNKKTYLYVSVGDTTQNTFSKVTNQYFVEPLGSLITNEFCIYFVDDSGVTVSTNSNLSA